MDRTDTKAFARRIRALLPEPMTVAQPAGSQAPSLGEALNIQAAATLIGCSTWTVRHSLIPQGLPCFRTGPRGKLIFYREQLVRWVERRQRADGGTT